MSEKILEKIKVVPLVAPKADLYATSVTTPEINAGKYGKVTFVIDQITAGTNTGTATVTIEACSDVSGTGAEAVAFAYNANESAGSSDDVGARTEVSAAGFTTTANKTAMYFCEIDAADLPAGKPFVRLKATEAVNDPVTGSIFALCEGRYKGEADTLVTALS
jgi:hypothetical protein